MTALQRSIAERKERGERVPLRPIAKKLDISLGWLSDVITGKGVPSLKLAKQLSEEFSVPLDEIARDA